jgi:hypothetical protein
LNNDTINDIEQRNPVLDPIQRVTEIVFGILMALSFTGTLSITSAGRAEVQTLLHAALGCNLAWGIADAMIYLVVTQTERHRGDSLLRRLQATTDAGDGRRQIADVLPVRLAAVATTNALETLRQQLLSVPTHSPRLTLRDLRAAFGVFLLVVFTTFPIAIPFIFISEAGLALRVSNGMAVAMLFISGYVLGRHAGGSPWRYGLGLTAVGAALVKAIIALGG